MAEQWHYAKEKERFGPVSIIQLKELIQSGKVQQTDYVWKKGMASWVSANTIAELISPHLDNEPPPPLPQTDKASSSAISSNSNFNSQDLLQKIWENIEKDLPIALVAIVIIFTSFILVVSDSLRLVSILIDLVFIIIFFKLLYTKYFSSHLEKLYAKGGPHLPENFPWTKEERDTKNFWTLLCYVFAGLSGLIGFFVIASPAPVFCLSFFSVSGFLLFLGIYKHKMFLHGRWVPASNSKNGWVEFASNGVFRNEKGDVFSFWAFKNARFIDFLKSEKLVDSWRIIRLEQKSFEIQDMHGNTISFKKGKTLEEKQSEFFKFDRIQYLYEKWDSVDKRTPSVQFTKDGAMIRFDGYAARFTLIGEEPNEVVRIHINNKESVDLKVLSLNRDELVLSNEGKSTHYKRGVSISKAEATKRSNESTKALAKVVGAPFAVLGSILEAMPSSGGGSSSGGGNGSGLGRACTFCNGTGLKHSGNSWIGTLSCATCNGTGRHNW